MANAEDRLLQTLNKEKTKAGRVERNRREYVKAEVFEFEQKNQSKLVAFRSTDAWWKMGGVSALIYVRQVARRLGKEPQLRPDKDFFSKFDEGIVSIKDIDNLQRDLQAIGIKLAKDGENIKVFELGYKLTKDEIQKLREEDKLLKAQLNQLLLPKVTMPNLFAHLRDMNQIAYNKQRNGTAANRAYIVDDLAWVTRRMLEKYMAMARGKEEQIPTLAVLEKDLETVRSYLAIIAEVKIFDMKTCLRFAGKLVETQTLTHNALKKLEKEAEEDDAGADKE